jgi:hypothetical protein
MGFSTGDIIWYEPMSQKYARLNKNVRLYCNIEYQTNTQGSRILKGRYQYSSGIGHTMDARFGESLFGCVS